MKKILLILLICALYVYSVFAQLKVQDTLLLAFSNDVFWGASSELDKGIYADFGKYGSTKLADNDSTTCWAEGAEGDGSNEYILLTIPGNTSKIEIRNGYQKNENIYYANNRPKNIDLTLYALYEPPGYVTETYTGFFISESIFNTSLSLKDKLGYQTIETGINWPDIISKLPYDKTFEKDRFILKIRLIDVYKGKKWNDACISDIKITHTPTYELSNDEHGLLKKLKDTTDTLFYNSEKIYQVIEVSTDLRWAIFIIMPSELDGRTETTYKLYNLTSEEFLEINDVFLMYEFEEIDGKVYLLGSDNDYNDFSICLDEL